MKKAANINEFANNLIPENFLKPEDKNFYVPVYDEILQVLRNMVINDQVEAQTFFVTGQAGTGKTTALNFFNTKELEESYCLKYINMRDFLDLSDVDIIDFMLAFAFALVKGSNLEDKYYERLVELQEKHDGVTIENEEKITERKNSSQIGGEVSVGAGFFSFARLKAGFLANLKLDVNYRKTSRKVFQLKKPYLHDLINEVIDEYVEKIGKGKKLLVIIDDLDKLKEIGQINSIFIENRNYIFNLKCKKIIAIPMYLSKTPEIFNYSQYPIRQFILRLTRNPFDTTYDPNQGDDKMNANRDILRQIIRCRIVAGKEEELLTPESLEKAIDYSGGIIRQLIRILYVAAVGVRATGGVSLSLKDITDAVDLLRNSLAGTITSSEKIILLDTILSKNIPVSEDSNQFIELLQANNVLAYENGDPWYEVNPIISETVKTYAAKQGNR